MPGLGEDALINTLQHNAVASGNRMLERRLADLTVWFHQNKKRVPRDNLRGRHELLEKAFWISLEVNAMLLERLLEIEHGKTTQSSQLWLPRGVTIEGDVSVNG